MLRDVSKVKQSTSSQKLNGDSLRMNVNMFLSLSIRLIALALVLSHISVIESANVKSVGKTGNTGINKDRIKPQASETYIFGPNAELEAIHLTPEPLDPMKPAASHHHHKKGSKGWLDMGAWTKKKGAFGWFAEYPVGKGR